MCSHITGSWLVGIPDVIRIATLCRRSSLLSNQGKTMTRHARYAMISPTRTPSCLRFLASSLLFDVNIVIADPLSELWLLRRLWFWRGNGRCFWR